MAHEPRKLELGGFSVALLEVGVLLLVHVRRREWGDVGLEDCSGFRGGVGVRKHTSNSQRLKSSSLLDVEMDTHRDN